MYLDPTARDVLVIVGVALGLLAVLLALLALRRLGRLRRDLVLLQAADDENSFLAIVARKTEEVQALRASSTTWRCCSSGPAPTCPRRSAT